MCYKDAIEAELEAGRLNTAHTQGEIEGRQDLAKELREWLKEQWNLIPDDRQVENPVVVLAKLDELVGK
jgi:hypothetical protein